MNKNILSIDTSDRAEIKISIQTQDNKFEENSIQGERDQVTLSLIDSAIKKSGINISAIDQISVFRGPGSFTGLRVGLAIANALSFALQKPINDKKLGYYEDAVY